MAGYTRYGAEEKPYKFVRIEKLDNKARRSPSGHDTYRPDGISGTLYGDMKALSPIHVASGQMELTDDKRMPLMKSHTRRDGGKTVIVPGSSLKGCIRSIVEAISASCVRITRANYQLPPQTSACRDEKEKSNIKLCVACRIFGSMGYMGKARFSDAILRNGSDTATAFIPQLHKPGRREDVYLYDNGKVIGRKFYRHGRPVSGNTPIEVCPAGSRLDFTISFDDLTKAELGLMLIAMGQGEPKLYPKLGGAKPVCYGTIEISIERSEVLKDMREAYLQYDIEQTPINVDECVKAAEELVLGEKLEWLAEILKLDQDRQCPSGNY